MKPVYPAMVLAAWSLVGLVACRRLRGHRRLVLLRTCIYIGVPACSATLVLVPLEFDTTFSDALSVAGLFLSLVFGIGARVLDRLTMRARIGVVIPSRVSFHTELRIGLREGLTSVRADVYDDYLTRSQGRENLGEFVPALRRTLAWRPDYVAICSPSVALASNEAVLQLLAAFCARGGGIVFIDNEPTEEARTALGSHYGFVHADVESAARILADYVQNCMRPEDKILVLSGPPSSEPAERYRRVLEERCAAGSIAVGDPNGWTERATYDALRRHLAKGLIPRFVLCGNDVMAFGAVRAVRDTQVFGNGSWPIEVLGYDGIARSLFAIAEVGNPLAATVLIPPGAYGHEIAAMIIDDATRMFGRSRLSRRCIPIGEGQLIHQGNVDLILDD